MEGDNQKISTEQLALIRRLGDFDLTMLLSEIHDHGWEVAEKTLGMIRESCEVAGGMKPKSS